MLNDNQWSLFYMLNILSIAFDMQLLLYNLDIILNSGVNFYYGFSYELCQYWFCFTIFTL